MLKSVHESIKRAATQLGLGDKAYHKLISFDAEHRFDITIPSGKSYSAYRMQHSNRRGPYKGGVRFHPEVDEDEVRALATEMTLKTALLNLPLGGGKGGVVTDPKSISPAELEEISRQYVAYLASHIGPDKDVPAPDMGTSAQVMDWMVDEYENQTGDTSRASFTGKSVKNGGSLGREEATGRGGVIVLGHFLKANGLLDRPLNYVLQGYGNVGLHFANIAAEILPNLTLVAATDSSGGIYRSSGLDQAVLRSYKQSGKKLADLSLDGSTSITNGDLIKGDADILVLAALGGAVTHDNQATVRAKFVLELANGPVEVGAAISLYKRQIEVIPDILANAGGVVVSYFEWLQNRQKETWTESEVNSKLAEFMGQASADTLALAKRKKISYRDAAYQLAVQRIIQT